MLDGYVSEKEQMESIRKWWNENGKWLAIAIVVGLCLGFGWRYWQKISMRRAENASVVYQSILQAEAEHQTASVDSATKLLMTHFASSPYASLAALLSAKNALSQNDTKTAMTQLQWVLNHTNQSSLKEMAALSMARILLSEKQFNAASAALKTTYDAHFAGLIAWVKGDIAAAQSDQKTASAQYQIAKNAFADYAPAQKTLSELMAG